VSWQVRLQQLLLAGGSLALPGCVPGCGQVCNANPDPCCQDKHSQNCADSQACLSKGESYGYEQVDGGYQIVCMPQDAGVADLAEPPDLKDAGDASEDGASHD
jgi:hypothetical protein